MTVFQMVERHLVLSTAMVQMNDCTGARFPLFVARWAALSLATVPRRLPLDKVAHALQQIAQQGNGDAFFRGSFLSCRTWSLTREK